LSDKKRQGLGLLGMRERVHSIGGTITIRSAPEQGTTIEVLVPLEK
jgi:signal transduction histidine kinase